MKRVIKLEHGGGGLLMRQLLDDTIVPAYKWNKVDGGVGLPEMDDGASIPLDGRHLIVTTDTYTVKPLFFPGGNIGRLAVCGTVNDVAVMGATPIALTSALVLEEGLSMEVLERVVNSMGETLEKLGIPLVAGDTKIVERGCTDEILITTSGVGFADRVVTDSGLRPGDKVILTGTVGNHQLSLLASREGLNLKAPIESDAAPLFGLIRGAMNVGYISAMKDPTRGGVSGALNEMAKKSGVDITIREEDIPIKEVVMSTCELLGLDPLELANEGMAILGVDEDSSKEVLEAIRKNEYGGDAAIVGEVQEGGGRAILETFVGGKRVIREPVGSPMPRIC
ncbi:MAG: hydrogenase expression/formation protein HypE [Candidatus Bathyarchaeota archaeon]|nr:MAG: hydrogenase expression/formation protein HypE [Candidatus Bathyarchaeota archaeon]